MAAYPRRYSAERIRTGKIGRGLYFAGNQKLGTYAYLGLPPLIRRLFSIKMYYGRIVLPLLKMQSRNGGLKGVLLDSGAITQTRLFDFASGLRTHLREQGLLTLLALEWEQELDWAAAAEGGQI